MQGPEPVGGELPTAGPLIANRHMVSAIFPMTGNNTTTVPKNFNANGAVARRRLTG